MVFKDLGIKSRVLMLSLLPTSLLALVLGGYFTWMQLSELQAQLLQRGHMAWPSCLRNVQLAFLQLVQRTISVQSCPAMAAEARPRTDA